ncbi:hypothetical protein N8D74_06685 [Curtobacterium flaccumfaciens]|uniref:Uncharacterized protein n=1 Tax=Curtobacterium poinsettiae TaxID=159612 RepID=A0A9Q9P976_9MICO|nr:hypothetical protein [Curtobacterium flaccumfaciens]UXN26561.1 hypothetical protein N8D74_06685 [Curtobacterium flaccumfaciens]UYC81404.1 hypothetical protein OE229_02775 [Curtobacterium flaccumfaciens pv. poinsettiae]
MVDLLQRVTGANSELVDTAVHDNARLRETACNLPLLDELRLPVIMSVPKRVLAELVAIYRVLEHTIPRIVAFDHIPFVNGRRGREGCDGTGQKHLNFKRELLRINRPNDYVLAAQWAWKLLAARMPETRGSSSLDSMTGVRVQRPTPASVR